MLISVVLGTASFGCAGPMDSASGGDHVRGKAKDITIGGTFDDHVSADAGDHTDWKHVVIPGDMKLQIDAWWDDPSVDATIYIKDQFGGAVFELAHEGGLRKDSFKGMKLREGEYYLQIVATRGASVYTLELTGQGSATTRPGTNSIAPPE